MKTITDNATVNIIKNNVEVNEAYVACVIAHNDYVTYKPNDYNGATVMHISHLEAAYNKAVINFQKLLKEATK